jgi:CBS domain-containing protein
MQHTEIKRIQVLDALQDQTGQIGALRVADLMTRAPACVSATTSALELVQLFHAKNFRHLLVTDRAGRLSGVISDRDVLRCFGADRRPTKKALAAISASQLMSTDVVTIGPKASLVEALRLMLEQGISCLPVMADDLLVGIITNTDLHVMLDILLERWESAEPPRGAGVQRRAGAAG